MPQSLEEKLAVLRAAISQVKQVTGLGNDLPREFCPHVLGRKHGEWQVLVWQFGGLSESGLPSEGQWRCFKVDKMDHLALRDGDWYRGAVKGNHDQWCVDDIVAIVDDIHAAEIQDW